MCNTGIELNIQKAPIWFTAPSCDVYHVHVVYVREGVSLAVRHSSLSHLRSSYAKSTNALQQRRMQSISAMQGHALLRAQTSLPSRLGHKLSTYFAENWSWKSKMQKPKLNLVLQHQNIQWRPRR